MLRKKHRVILTEVFTNPIPADILWQDIMSLFKCLGADITEGKGSRVRIVLNNRRAVFHRPHPSPSTNKGAVVSVRKFLLRAGIKYDEI